MGEQREVKRRIHSLAYIYQMMDWGFSKEFIAKDMGVELSSLELRLKRNQEREKNGNKRPKPKTSGNKPISGSGKKTKR